jgi:hypothetical protein
MTLFRLAAAVFVVVSAAACRDEARLAPTPTAYLWPDSMAFKMEYIAESRSDSALVVRYEERKELVLVARDEGYLAWHDSVVKESVGPQRPGSIEPYEIEDTLPYYVRLDRRGRVTGSEPACDPALPACQVALPSVLPLELLRIVPRLPVWAPPRGETWEDTLFFDDRPRPRGARGSVVTLYRVAGDTLVAGTPLWKVVWHSVRRTFEAVPGPIGMAAGLPVEESGLAFVDKERELPVFAMWAGGVAAPPELRAAGVTATVFRGRAYLAGSVVERVLAPPE